MSHGTDIDIVMDAIDRRKSMNDKTYVEQSGPVTPGHFAVWTTDGVIQDARGIAPPSGASGSIGWTNVKDAPFNAVGNGIADDSAAIQQAAASIPSTGGVLFFPPSVYGVTRTIAINSNTIVMGYGATLLALTGMTGSFIANANGSVTSLTDHDIEVQGLTFDYGSSGAGGGAHCINMAFVKNVRVSSCTFQCRNTAGNATACVGCYNTSVENCSAFDFINCAYDHWWGPKYARVINCYAETANSAQIVNFNPEDTSNSLTLQAVGFVMTGCEFKANRSTAIPMQLEVLTSTPGNAVSDMVIANNIFTNVSLITRGAVNGVSIIGNVFQDVAGGGEVIVNYQVGAGTGSNFTIIGNTIINPSTLFANLGVIRMYAANSSIIGNIIIGTGYTAYAIDVDTNPALIVGNQATGPINDPNGGITVSNLVLKSGVSFGSQTAAGPTDFSKHIALWGNVAGFNITSSTVNYSTFGGGAHIFYQGGSEIGFWNSGGINLAAGLGYYLNGTPVLTGFASNWGTPTGGARIFNFDGATATPTQTAQVVAQLILDLQSTSLFKT